MPPKHNSVAHIPHTYRTHTTQASKNFSDKGDHANESLIKYIKDDVWQRRTYRAYRALLDNYEWETGNMERVTTEEKREMDEFIDATMETRPMQHVYSQVWEGCLTAWAVGLVLQLVVYQCDLVVNVTYSSMRHKYPAQVMWSISRE